MLIASRGVQPALRGAARALKQPQTSSLHTASLPFKLPTINITSPIANATNSTTVKSARTFLAKVFSQIIPAQRTLIHGPGIRALNRGAHTTTASASIKQGLSLPARVAIARPFGVPYMPRAPTVVNRSVAQVGLGTARNFSSGRPLYQNMVQNVPIASRTFCEADINLKMKSANRHLRLGKENAKASNRKEMLKSRGSVSTLSVVTSAVAAVREAEAESEEDSYYLYFAEAPSEPYITTLSIPLAPAGSRAPLDPTPSALTYDIIVGIHDAYSEHSTRVASLFRRLDRANVWDRGATCECFDTSGDGVCRVLRVRFDGWTIGMLKDVIGEGGKGWCEIKSEAKPSVAQSHELVMPSLDFSSTFPIDLGAVTDSIGWDSEGITPSSELGESLSGIITPLHSDIELAGSGSEDGFDMDSVEEEEAFEEDRYSSSSSSGVWVGFSSSFADKASV